MIASAAVGRERENPRSRAKARPAALKVQLYAVGPFYYRGERNILA